MSGLNKETSEQKWKEVLSAQEYQVLRQKGTEAPGTGTYNKFFEEGVYNCAACGATLYKSETKFNSGCGWRHSMMESQARQISDIASTSFCAGSVERRVDDSFGMRRIEIMCSSCGGHLGHVFEGEGFSTPTNARHCVNSICLKFSKE